MMGEVDADFLIILLKAEPVYDPPERSFTSKHFSVIMERQQCVFHPISSRNKDIRAV